MAIRAEELRVKVTADTKGAKDGLEDVDSKAGSLKSGFGIAKAAAVSFATGAAASLAGKVIGAASDLNETVSKTGVVFGDQTGTVTAYAQKMADDFGLSKTAVLDAASSFGLLGSAAGLSGKPLADMSTNLAGLAADAMSFYNVPLEQALGDFSSALSGETEPVKKYGVLMNEAAVQAEALATGIAKPVKNTQALQAAQVGARAAQEAYNAAVKKHGKDSVEAQKAQVALAKANDKVAAAAKGAVPPLTEGQKVQARYSLLTKGLSKAQGDLARTQDSVANRAKELQGRVVNLAADMGQKLLPAAGAVLGGLVGLIDALPKVAGFIQENKTIIKIVAAIIGTVLLPMLIRWGVTSTVSAAKSVAAWVTTQAAAIRSSWAQVGAGVRVIGSWIAMGANAVRSGAQTVAVWALYKAEAAKAAAAQVAAQARIIASWVAMQAQAMANAVKMATAWTIGIIRQAAVAAATMVAQAARVVGAWVLMGVQSMVQAARMAAAWFIALGPVGWVIAAVIGLVALIIANWDTVKRVTIQVWQAVVSWVKSAWEWIKGAVKAALAFVVNLVTLQFRVMLTVVRAAWNGIKSAVQAALAFVRSVISTYVNAYKSVISAAWNWIKSTTTGAWNGIKSAVSRAISGLLGLVRGIPGKIRSALGNLGRLLWDSGQRIMQGLADGIRAGLGRVKNAISGVLQQARNLLPFSPAKEGPFSGRGWTLYSGRSISKALAQGMRDEQAKVGKAALALAKAAVPHVPGVTAPGVGFGPSGAAAAVSGGTLRPSEMASGGPGRSTVINLTTYYPVQEKESQAVNRNLQRIAALPVG